jgi:HK97 family phage portal protein
MNLLGFRLPFTKRANQPSVADDRYFTPSPYVYLGDGTPVTPETALKFTAVFAAVRVIAGNLATLPLITYKRSKGGGRERAITHPLYKVLKSTPNQLKTTGLEFREMLTAHMLLWGNGYAQILRNSFGEVLELYPIHPTKVTPVMLPDEKTGRSILLYKVRRSNAEPLYLPADQVLHLRGYRDNGLEGLSPIMAAEKAIKSGLSLESFGSNFFEGGAFPSGVLEYDQGAMSQTAKDNLRESWQELHGGSNRGKKIAILEMGLKWKPMGIPQSDAQFLEQRRFQVEEIARIYGVPPHMLGDLSRSTNNNIEQQSQEFVTYCLLPWMKRWEEAVVRDLLDGDDSKYYVEFLADALLRGDTLSRTTSYKTQIESGILSPNEARAAENRNPYPGGDDFLIINKITKESLAKDDTAQVPTPAPVPAPGPAKKTAENEGKTLRNEENLAEIDVKEAFRGAFLDTWQRVVRKELGSMRTAAKKRTGPEFDAWLEEFVPNHMTFAGECLREVAKAYCTLSRLDPDAVLSTVSRDYERTIRDRALAWRQDPAAGYVCAEEEVAPYWTECLLNYTGGEHDQAA